MGTKEEDYARLMEKSHKLAQEIRNLYESGAKLWRKEDFLDIETQLRENPNRQSVMVRHVDGITRESRLPIMPADLLDGTGTYVTVDFTFYQVLVHEAKTLRRLDIGEDHEISYWIEADTDALKASFFKSYSAVYATPYPTESMSLEDVKAHWDAAQAAWLQSPSCAELISTFNKHSHLPKVTKIIGLGLGSLEFPVNGLGLDAESDTDGLPLRAAMTQHAAALTLAKLLGERQGCPPLKIMVQDPEYTDVDKKILHDEGIEVVEGFGALAFVSIDEETAVFSCCPNVPVKQIVADIAKPAAMIWNRVSRTETIPQWNKAGDGTEDIIWPWLTDEDSPRTRTMAQDYIEYDFADKDPRFTNLAIYIRKD